VEFEVKPIGRLRPLEARLIEAVERGQAFVPEPKERLDPAPIRARVFRAMFLGMKLRLGPLERRAVAVTRFGLRIHWPGTVCDPKSLLPIEGDLDLRDIAPAESLFLPPLVVMGCLFDGQMELSGAHIQSLYLENCRFSSLNAEGTRFAGSVRICRCGPPDPTGTEHFGATEFMGWTLGPSLDSDPPRPEVAFCAVTSAFGAVEKPAVADPFPDEAPAKACCEIFLRASSIGAGLKIEQCSLRAHRLRPATPTRSMRGVSALELSHAHVRDRVELVRSTFVGGARFVSADIGDDVWIWGGTFLALANRHALDFQFARIAGQLGVKGENAGAEDKAKKGRANAFFPVVVVGQFAAVGMSAGEVWISGGFFHGHDSDQHGSAPTLNFSKADIQRTFKLGLYHPHYMDLENRRGDRVYVHGELCLIAANVGKNLEIHGVQAGNVAKELGLGIEYNPFFACDSEVRALFKIGAEAVKVDRRVSFSHSKFHAGTDRRPDPEEWGQASPSSAATSAIDLFKATIGTGIKIRSDCACDGAVRLNSSLIGREAIIGCRIINAPPVHKGQDRGLIPWLLDMRESRVNGNLKIGRRSSEGDAVTIAGGITLESAKVHGSTAIRKLTLDLSTFAAVDGSKDSADARERTALNLRDFQCGSEFEVHRLRWILPPLNAAERRVLTETGQHKSWRLPMRNREYFNVQKASYAAIDLRGFRCGLLSDAYGDGWGLTYRLRLYLASFHAQEVESGSDEHIDSRLRWLNFQNRMQRVSEGEAANEPDRPDAMSSDGPAISSPRKFLARLVKEWRGLWERYHCSRGDDFVRHAYDVFALANSRAGEERATEEILVERKNIQATLRLFRVTRRAWDWQTTPYRLAWAALIIGGTHLASWGFEWRLREASFVILYGVAITVLLWPIGLGALQLISRYGFRYGFSPDRALLVLAACILAGTGAVHYGRFGGLPTIEDWTPYISGESGHLDADVAIVLDVPYAPAQGSSLAQITNANGKLIWLEPSGESEPKGGGSTRLATKLAYAEPSPCNLDVSSLLYAADVFIPVLDLDQENRCSIRHDDAKSGHNYTGWRIAKALYELLGWIVTSLVILVLSGVLRRDLERRISAEGPGEAGE
jgi:hypothetical protein